MGTDYSQANRTLKVFTPLGDDKLLLESFTGSEQISTPFAFELNLWSYDTSIAAHEIVGKNVTFAVETKAGTRYFNGHVRRFAAGILRDSLRHYQAIVAPWFWWLSRTTDCQIFQEQTVVDIVEQIFQQNGMTDYDLSAISGSHPQREYCVQYNESDLDFVSRLLEEEGIFYYFQHEDGKHTMILADSNTAFQKCQDSEVSFVYDSTRAAAPSRLTHFSHRYDYRSGKLSHTDYHFIDHPPGTSKSPAKKLFSTTNTKLPFGGLDQYERFAYPGRFETKSQGDALAKSRIEADEVPGHQIQGAGSHAHFFAGGKFKIAAHDVADEVGKTYLLTSLSHEAREDVSFRQTSAAGESGGYANRFEGIPEDTPFRPAATTSRPVMMGTQTAVVVGPPGEEIWPDQYGRVKVQFFWDRIGERSENSSCWVRCAQASAGKGWGSLFLPRVGQEVVVTYLEGNPDRPLITGVVYNADQMPPYILPDEKTKSYIKTNSSLGGDGFNEIRFEDLADHEQIFVHAQRNFDTRILHDSMELVLNDRHLIVGQEKDGNKVGNQYEQVYANKESNIKANQVTHIEGSFQFTVGKGSHEQGGNADIVIEKNKKELIEGDGEFHLKGDRRAKIDGSSSCEIGGDTMSKVAGDTSLEVGGNENKKTDGNYSNDVGGTIHEKAGQNIGREATQNLYLKAGMNVVIEAGVQLTLKAGPSFIVIGADGVSAVGPMVKLNSGGSAGSGAAPAPVAPTPPEAPADATLAQPTTPTEADDSESGVKSVPDSLS